MTRNRALSHVCLTLACVAVGPTPLAAQSIRTPEGCTAFLTVQKKGCGVSHYWRCEAGPEGAAWEASYDADGPVSLSLFDREFQWLDSQYVATATREYLVAPAADPASLTELLETGRDTYDFVIREDGPDGKQDLRHEGYDELIGRSVTIDGVELQVTAFSSRATDVETGAEIYSVTGQQYVLAEERLFFLGADTLIRDGDERTDDQSPVRFYHPGDAGFGQMTPRFDCAAPTEIALPGGISGAQPKETRDDL
jgi:hypothetical protein